MNKPYRVVTGKPARNPIEDQPSEQFALTQGAKLALRPREAAEALSVSPRTLWTLTQRGQIKCVRNGGVVLYSLLELSRWLQESQT